MSVHVKNIIQQILPSENQWHVKLLQQWPLIMGDFCSKVRLEKIHNDTLIIGVYDSIWLHELYLLSPLLVETINKQLDNLYVKQIKFRHVLKKKSSYYQPQNHSHPEPKPVKLTSRELMALNKIQDNELRNALIFFRSRCNGEKI